MQRAACLPACLPASQLAAARAHRLLTTVGRGWGCVAAEREYTRAHRRPSSPADGRCTQPAGRPAGHAGTAREFLPAHSRDNISGGVPACVRTRPGPQAPGYHHHIGRTHVYARAGSRPVHVRRTAGRRHTRSATLHLPVCLLAGDCFCPAPRTHATTTNNTGESTTVAATYVGFARTAGRRCRCRRRRRRWSARRVRTQPAGRSADDG